jgi:hypothetical protein
MQNCFCFKILLSAPKTANRNENKNYWFMYDLNWKCAHLFSFDATELKIAPKSSKVFLFTEKIILKHFFWFLNFVKMLKMKSCHGPQETPKQNFEKNSLVYCQTSLLLKDAVWVETVSLKLVEEIAFVWASQTDHFNQFG